MILISPRKAASAWSAVNKAHVARAIASGAMTPPGLAKVTAAQQNGMWSFLDDVEPGEVPPDLAHALGSCRPVWDAFPRYVQRGTLEWIKRATPTARIAELAASTRDSLRPRLSRR